MQQSQRQLILVMGLVTAFVIFGGTIYLLSSRQPESGPAGPAFSAGATGNVGTAHGIPDTAIVVIGTLTFPGQPKPAETKVIQSTPSPKTLWVFNDATVTVTLPSLNFSHEEKVVYLDSQDQFQFLFTLPNGATPAFPLEATVTIRRHGFKDAVLDRQEVGGNKRLILPAVSLTR